MMFLIGDLQRAFRMTVIVLLFLLSLTFFFVNGDLFFIINDLSKLKSVKFKIR